jgi:hypothetical protein
VGKRGDDGQEPIVISEESLFVFLGRHPPILGQGPETMGVFLSLWSILGKVRIALLDACCGKPRLTKDLTAWKPDPSVFLGMLLQF